MNGLRTTEPCSATKEAAIVKRPLGDGVRVLDLCERREVPSAPFVRQSGSSVGKIPQPCSGVGSSRRPRPSRSAQRKSAAATVPPSTTAGRHGLASPA